MHVFAQALPRDHSLKTISMNCHRVPDEEMVEIVKSLLQMPLEVLLVLLEGRWLGDDCMRESLGYKYYK